MIFGKYIPSPQDGVVLLWVANEISLSFPTHEYQSGLLANISGAGTDTVCVHKTVLICQWQRPRLEHVFACLIDRYLTKCGHTIHVWVATKHPDYR